ncbi:hypothetical protein F5Y19DRAFT_398614 [Xylariaceae sp. FL1651]|nr:hypothetical protein F5Y19DRAFT_398614 [Xylariaceae sp. FL1651]
MSSQNRRITRANARASARSDDHVTLSDTMEAVIQHAQAVAHLPYREQKYAAVDCPKFHYFLRLPIELRELIYFFAMEEPGSPRNVATMQWPTLALVSKQVRYEALRVFPAKCSFYVKAGEVWDKDVIVGYADGGRIRLGSEDVLKRWRCARPSEKREVSFSGFCEPLDRSENHQLGKQSMEASMEDWTPFLANIEIRILRRLGILYNPSEWSRLSLRAHKGALTVEYEGPASTMYMGQFDRLRDRAEKCSRDIAHHRDNFAGFSIQELAKIVDSLAAGPVKYSE